MLPSLTPPSWGRMAPHSAEVFPLHHLPWIQWRGLPAGLASRRTWWGLYGQHLTLRGDMAEWEQHCLHTIPTEVTAMSLYRLRLYLEYYLTFPMPGPYVVAPFKWDHQGIHGESFGAILPGIRWQANRRQRAGAEAQMLLRIPKHLSGRSWIP